jgi:hypothetical protein
MLGHHALRIALSTSAVARCAVRHPDGLYESAPATNTVDAEPSTWQVPSFKAVWSPKHAPRNIIKTHHNVSASVFKLCHNQCLFHAENAFALMLYRLQRPTNNHQHIIALSLPPGRSRDSGNKPCRTR